MVTDPARPCPNGCMTDADWNTDPPDHSGWVTLHVDDADHLWVDDRTARERHLLLSAARLSSGDYTLEARGVPLGELPADARKAFGSVEPDDIVEPAGYPRQQPVEYRLVHDGEVRAVAHYFDDGHDGWLLDGVDDCRDNVSASPGRQYPRVDGAAHPTRARAPRPAPAPGTPPASCSPATRPGAWRAALLLTGRREMADDVTQDAFERAFAALVRSTAAAVRRLAAPDRGQPGARPAAPRAAAGRPRGDGRAGRRGATSTPRGASCSRPSPARPAAAHRGRPALRARLLADGDRRPVEVPVGTVHSRLGRALDDLRATGRRRMPSDLSSASSARCRAPAPTPPTGRGARRWARCRAAQAAARPRSAGAGAGDRGPARLGGDAVCPAEVRHPVGIDTYTREAPGQAGAEAVSGARRRVGIAVTAGGGCGRRPAVCITGTVHRCRALAGRHEPRGGRGRDLVALATEPQRRAGAAAHVGAVAASWWRRTGCVAYVAQAHARYGLHMIEGDGDMTG